MPYTLITLRACARGKVIGSVNIKITRSEKRLKHPGGQQEQMVVSGEKKCLFLLLNARHSPRALQIVQLYWPRMLTIPIPCVEHMLKLSVGKGRQEINCSTCQTWVGTATSLSGVYNASYTVL